MNTSSSETNSLQDSTSPIVVALDYPVLKQAIEMAKQLDPKKCRVKVGKELFTASGPVVLEQLHKRDFDVFTWVTHNQCHKLTMSTYNIHFYS